ncbi:MAG: hypothetical protein F6J93_39925 [Oscillatoria sp. SIO1A7]|nr:hypothetical protein [Oscillatoria sp. SIO1A7]
MAGIQEAQILASTIDYPQTATEDQLERWVQDIAVSYQLCYSQQSAKVLPYARMSVL